MTETNVFQLSQPGTFTDPLTAVLRNGARALLARQSRPRLQPCSPVMLTTNPGRPPAAGPSRASVRA